MSLLPTSCKGSPASVEERAHEKGPGTALVFHEKRKYGEEKDEQKKEGKQDTKVEGRLVQLGVGCGF